METQTLTNLKTKSALSYFGSDSEVASRLAGMLDHCKHVTIPFCGGMSILPHLKARAVVANDLHFDAITFYRVASGVYGERSRDSLFERCRHTLSHPSEIEIAEQVIDDTGSAFAERAWAFWALCWIGRKGKGGTKSQGGSPSVRRTAIGGNNATRICSAADDLTAWAKHFERCEWQDVCFTKLLPKVADRPDTGIYADPPWVDVGKVYRHAFGKAEHVDLARRLRLFGQTAVVLRYGDHPLIRELYSGDQFRIIEAESRDQCNAVKGEIWITNAIEKGNL